MKPIYSFLIALGVSAGCLPTHAAAGTLSALPAAVTSPLPAGPDMKAREILAALSAKYRTSGSVKLTFKGTQQGTLWLKADRFYLNCGGVESWFDGQTQWSYVAANEEVTVSNPTAEELQSVNPFVLLNAAQTLFDGCYAGTEQVNGQPGEKVLLTPKAKGDIHSVTLVVSADRQPLSLTLQLSNGEKHQFLITSYQPHQDLPDSAFRFPTAKYPNAEIIDMR